MTLYQKPLALSVVVAVLRAAPVAVPAVTLLCCFTVYDCVFSKCYILSSWYAMPLTSQTFWVKPINLQRPQPGAAFEIGDIEGHTYFPEICTVVGWVYLGSSIMPCVALIGCPQPQTDKARKLKFRVFNVFFKRSDIGRGSHVQLQLDQHDTVSTIQPSTRAARYKVVVRKPNIDAYTYICELYSLIISRAAVFLKSSTIAKRALLRAYLLHSLRTYNRCCSINIVYDSCIVHSGTAVLGISYRMSYVVVVVGYRTQRKPGGYSLLASYTGKRGCRVEVSRHQPLGFLGIFP